MARPAKLPKFDPNDPEWQEAALQWVDPSAWAEHNNFYIPDAGQLFTLKGHEYLWEFFNDDAPFIVCLKGVQLVYTTSEIIKDLHGCAYKYKSGIIYYFPTKTDVVDVSKTKVGPLIDANPILKDLVRDTDTATVKKIGQCMLHFRGLKSIVQARTISADKLVFDEIDVSDQQNIDHAMKRLDHSDFAEVSIFSTPTMVDYGVDEAFQKTDQKYRMMYCEACRHYTCMEEDFPACLVMTPEGAKRVCVKCGKELPLLHPKHKFVAKYPGKLYQGRPASGYCVSQLHSAKPFLLDKIYEEYFTTRYPADFWNSRMARAYTDAKDRLEEAHVLALCKGYGMEHTSGGISTIMGIDVGPEKHHVVVGRKEYGGTVRIIYIGTSSWGGLDDLMKRYNCYSVIDGLPFPARAIEWAKQYPHRAWICYYSNSFKTGIHWDDTAKKVSVYQTQAMDASHDMIQEGKVLLPAVSDITKEFAKHCHNVARKKVEDEDSGAVRHTWIKQGPDHYRKAFSYMCLLIERSPENKYSGRDYSYLDGSANKMMRRGIASTYAT